MKTYKQIFENKWLFEMPRRTGDATPGKIYNRLVKSVLSNLDQGQKFKKHPDGLCEMVVDDTQYYWIGEPTEIKIDGEDSDWTGNSIEIITETFILDNKIVVIATGKRPTPDSNIHASDLYGQILKNTSHDMLFSGETLSTQGEGACKWMMNNKNVIAYKPGSPLHYKKISGKTEFEQLMGADPEFEKYRFILSNGKQKFVENVNSFDTFDIYCLVNRGE